MIVDRRTYELQPTRLQEFLAPHESEPPPVRKKQLDDLVDLQRIAVLFAEEPRIFEAVEQQDIGTDFILTYEVREKA